MYAAAENRTREHSLQYLFFDPPGRLSGMARDDHYFTNVRTSVLPSFLIKIQQIFEWNLGCRVGRMDH